MAAHKGQKKVGGRQKGTGNKNTTALKDMILQALNEVGGVKYLKQQSQDNPTAFMTIVGKVLPLTVNHGGQPDNPIRAILDSIRNGTGLPRTDDIPD